MEGARQTAFTARFVVRSDKDQRVVEFVDTFQRFDDSTNLNVTVFQLCRKTSICRR